jgi:hypothetical protein
MHISHLRLSRHLAQQFFTTPIRRLITFDADPAYIDKVRQLPLMGRVRSWGEVCVPSSFGSYCRRAGSDCGSRFGRRDDIDIGSRLRVFDHHDGGADHHDRTGHHHDPRDHDVGRRGHDDRVDDNQSAGNDHDVSQAERHHDDQARGHVDGGVHHDVASEAPAPAHR